MESSRPRDFAKQFRIQYRDGYRVRPDGERDLRDFSEIRISIGKLLDDLDAVQAQMTALKNQPLTGIEPKTFLDLSSRFSEVSSYLDDFAIADMRDCSALEKELTRLGESIKSFYSLLGLNDLNEKYLVLQANLRKLRRDEEELNKIMQNFNQFPEDDDMAGRPIIKPKLL